MKILFISNQLLEFTNYEPLGVLYLSSYLKRAGHITAFANSLMKEVVPVMDTFNPDIVAYSVTTGMHGDLVSFNRKLKEKYDFLSIFGGPHATFFPKMIEEEGIDIICIGEGEEAIRELADKLERKDDISSIKNLSVKTPAGIIKNDVRPLTDNLDIYPFPDRELIYSRNSGMRNSKIKFFITNRGCPFKCTYCFNHYLHKIYDGKGKIIRIRSVDNVIAEIQGVKGKYPLDFLKFVNDIFAFSDEWLDEFAEKYSKEIALPFYSIVRANMITSYRAKKLREAGCVSVAMGVESGNERIRNDVLKRSMKREDITEACRIIKSEGIKIFTQNILGLPGETYDNVLETLKLNIDCAPDYAWVSLYTPYPNTELGEKAKEMGLFDGNVNDFPATYHIGSPMKIPDKKRIERMQKLFAIAVEFRIVRPLLPYLVKIPAGRFYEFIRKLWKGYAFKSRIYPVKLSFSELFKQAVTFIFSKGG